VSVFAGRAVEPESLLGVVVQDECDLEHVVGVLAVVPENVLPAAVERRVGQPVHLAAIDLHVSSDHRVLRPHADPVQRRGHVAALVRDRVQ